jgi:pimeloyl-ACP methyl ester carboxylesterase
MPREIAFAQNGDVRIGYETLGDPALPAILMLHGFPENRSAWRKVAERLADRFFLVLPDQRGYGPSSKPEGVDSYRGRHLAADAMAVIEHAAPGRPFALAGHDWGASVAYAIAFARPERLTHLVIANGVHPWCFQCAIIDDAGQRAASQYMNRLKSAGAEQMLSGDGFRRLMNMIAGFSKTGWMTPAEADAYRAGWALPGALTAMLDWYRASPIVVPEIDEAATGAPILEVPAEKMSVTVPHLVIWGEADEALRPVCLEGLERFARNLTIERVPDAGHWILHEQPEAVARIVREFLNGGSAKSE